MEVKLKSSFSLHDQFREWQERGEMTDTLLVARGGSVAVHSLALLAGDGANLWRKILASSFDKDDPILVLLPDYNLEQLVKAVSLLYAPDLSKVGTTTVETESITFDTNNNHGDDDECMEENSLRSPINVSGRSPKDSSSSPCLDLLNDKYGKPEVRYHFNYKSCKKFRFTCGQCTKVFIDHRSLETHKLKHNKNKPQSFQCDQCPKVFKLFCHLNIHKRTHTGEKPYPCDVCGKRFSESGSMKKHKMRHSGERPFICETCSKSFATRGDLYVHKRIHNRTMGEKLPRRFLCDICSKSFSQVNNLTVHKRIHTGEKPYTCEHCQKTFTQSNDLKTHKRTHNGEKPFQCHQCPMRFSTNANMKRHILVHTGEKPYTCDQCPKAFNQPDPLKKHKLTHNQNFAMDVSPPDINLFDCIPEFIENQVKVIQEVELKSLQ